MSCCHVLVIVCILTVIDAADTLGNMGQHSHMVRLPRGLFTRLANL